MTMPELTVLSLGGGVQSTALALMANADRFDNKPDVAFFADTGWEPQYVYDTIEAVRERVSFAVETVSNGRNLADDVLNGVAANGNAFTPIPLFNSNGSQSVRQCTNQYKIVPISKGIRRWLGVETGHGLPPGTVEQWMGISADEYIRAKDNKLKYIRNRFPLIEEMITRRDCVRWMEEHHPDIPLGKSSCTGCPYHSPAAWVRIAKERPADFAKAVEIDRALRTEGHNEMNWREGLSYLHSSRRPLDEAVAMAVATDSLFDDDDENMSGLCDSGHCFI